MRSFLMKFVAAVVIAACGMAVSVCEGAEKCEYAPGTALKFKAGERYIHDQYGRAVMFRGANLGSCYYGNSVGFTEENLALLKESGFNFIRLNLGWDIIERENDVFDEKLMGELAAFIEKASEYGLYTMPDFHQMLWEAHIPAWMRDESLGHDYLSELSPVAAAQSDRFWASEELQDELIEFMVFLARNFRGVDGLFGHDLFNEPFSMKGNSYAAFEKCCLFPFYEKAIVAVREVDPDAPIVIEPHPQSVVLPAYTRPFDDKNLVYSPHVYFPHSYGPKGLVINMEETPADVRRKFGRFQKDAEKMGAPWLVGEYGGDPVSYPFTGPWLMENMKMQEKYFVGSAIWAFSAKGGGGWTINDTASTLWPHMAELLIRPYPRYTAGTPLKLHFDEKKQVFSFSFVSDAGACAPTEIFYPRALFSISTVEVRSGCNLKWRYEEGIQAVLVDAGCGGEVEVVIAPGK